MVTNNHGGNVKAFQILTSKYPSNNPLCIWHPDNLTNTYLFFGNVQLIKIIRNNLLNTGKFVFLAFSLQIMKDRELTSADGYLDWSDLHAVYDRDVALEVYLR